MSNITKSHDFEKQQNKLKDFSKKIPQNRPFTSFKENGGIFNLFDAKVTGKSLNEFVKDVSSEFIQQKELSIEIIQEFKTIYDTFEKLDKDYIQSIIVAINSAKASSNQALKNSEDIRKLLDGTRQLTKKLQEKFSVLEKDFEQVNKNCISIRQIEIENKNNTKKIENTKTIIKEIENQCNKLQEENKYLINTVNNLEKKLSSLENDNTLKFSILTCITIISLIVSSVTLYLLFKS